MAAVTDLPADTKVEFHGTIIDGIQTVTDLLFYPRWPDGFALVVNKDPDPRFCLVTVEPLKASVTPIAASPSASINADLLRCRSSERLTLGALPMLVPPMVGIAGPGQRSDD